MQTITLISDAEAASRKCGFDVIEHLLFTQIRLDAQPFITPMILRDGETERLMVRQQEAGNMVSSGADVEDLVFYEPWVSIDQRVLAGIPVAPTLTDALVPIVGDRVLHLNAGVVRAHYDALSARMSVEVEAAQLGQVSVSKIEEADVLAWFEQTREESTAVARKLVLETSNLQPLVEAIGSVADTRFEALRELLATTEAGALLVSSSPNYSELTAQSHRAGSWVLYIPQERALYLIDESTEDAAPGSETHTSVIEAVRALAGGHTLAIEEQYLSAALSLELEKAGFTFACVSMPLGNWRDVRDHEDLAAQIIAARSTTEAIEEALAVVASLCVVEIHFTIRGSVLHSLSGFEFG